MRARAGVARGARRADHRVGGPTRRVARRCATRDQVWIFRELRAEICLQIHKRGEHEANSVMRHTQR